MHSSCRCSFGRIQSQTFVSCPFSRMRLLLGANFTCFVLRWRHRVLHCAYFTSWSLYFLVSTPKFHKIILSYFHSGIYHWLKIFSKHQEIINSKSWNAHKIKSIYSIFFISIAWPFLQSYKIVVCKIASPEGQCFYISQKNNAVRNIRYTELSAQMSMIWFSGSFYCFE